jgi:alpha-L-fucosidase 2
MLRRWNVCILLLLLMYTVNAQENLSLWYKQPAARWTDALPLGNGRIGAMVFGGVQDDRIQFNEETLWTGEPRDYTRPGAARYLDTIRQLIAQGKQKEAEALAEAHFMGSRSTEGKTAAWKQKVLTRQGLKGNPALSSYDDSQWKTMRVPSYEGWENAGFEGLDGAVWVRTRFSVPATWQAAETTIDLNRVRGDDYVYVNGKLLTRNDQYKYKVPAGLLKKDNNTIAVLVLNYFDKGGVAGYKDTTKKIGIYPSSGNGNDRVILNGDWKYFIQDDNPPPAPRYQADYQPFGDLWLHFPHRDGSVTGYRRSLDISKAISYTSYKSGDTTFRREYLVSQPHQLLAVKLDADRTRSVSLQIELASPHKNAEVRTRADGSMVLKVQVRNGVLKGQADLRVSIRNGKLSIKNNRVIVEKADEVVIYLTAATNYRNYKDVTADPATLSAAAMQQDGKHSYDQVKAAHLKEYRMYYDRFFVTFGETDNDQLPTDERLANFAHNPDPSFAALYMQYGRYLLIASSRPGTRPANLQGIWNDLLQPPWGSKYTTNINLEMNYWPAELLNLSVLHEPLFAMIAELAETGKHTARVHYNMPGWVLHHNTDLWRGTAPINAANHGIWVTGGAWLCDHLWEHYRYTLDKKFLATKAYPIMKDAALFFHHFLVRDPKTGWLISTPSNSPEHGGLVAGPAMDHQLIRNLFRQVISAAEILDRDAAFRDTLKEQLAQIAPDQIGRFGQLQEWLEDKDDKNDKHRHVSHLWAVYPGSEINADDQPALLKAARQSLLFRGDEATGWSLGWKINLWARFLDGNHSFQLVKMLLSPAKNGAGSYNNLFDAHPPFQIDGNFGGAAGLGELLLQSHTNYIDILPALPDELPEGTVRGLCARGGFEVDMNWRKGSLQQVKIVSHAGDTLRLRYKGKVKELPTSRKGVYIFDAELNKIN